MKDQSTPEQTLIQEMASLRKRIEELEQSESKLKDDITSGKLAEEAPRESEERYRTILENIEDGYFEVDIAGNMTFFNDSVCRMIGYTRAELMGMNNRHYTDKENSRILYQAFNKVFRTGESSKGVGYEIIGKDGTILYIESSVSEIDPVNRSGFAASCEISPSVRKPRNNFSIPWTASGRRLARPFR